MKLVGNTSQFTLRHFVFGFSAVMLPRTFFFFLFLFFSLAACAALCS